MTQRNRNSNKKRKMPANYQYRSKQQILQDQATYERARQAQKRRDDFGNFALMVTTCLVIGGTAVWCAVQVGELLSMMK